MKIYKKENYFNLERILTSNVFNTHPIGLKKIKMYLNKGGNFTIFYKLFPLSMLKYVLEFHKSLLLNFIAFSFALPILRSQPIFTVKEKKKKKESIL